jgi:hypothetical protein
MKIFVDMKQNSIEWEREKLGKFSASACADLFAGKSTATYQGLIKRIAFERMYGATPESWDGNFWTERGHDLEPLAVQEQLFQNKHKDIKRVGLVVKDDWTCCSPDLLIGENKLMQIKAPKYSTQIDYLISKTIPMKYQKQMQFEMFVTQREENIFFSYHEVLPNVEIPLKVNRDFHKELEIRLTTAKEHVQELIKQLIDRS